jgi:protein-S-isoprenylcysteine O-methyltransferase Ste14
MAWVAFGSVSLIVVVLIVLGLVHLSRHSEAMTSGQRVMWAALIVLLPFIGLIGYLFWQLEHSDMMEPAMNKRRQREAAPFLQDPGRRD